MFGCGSIFEAKSKGGGIGCVTGGFTSDMSRCGSICSNQTLFGYFSHRYWPFGADIEALTA